MKVTYNKFNIDSVQAKSVGEKLHLATVHICRYAFINADVQIFILWGFHFTLTSGFGEARFRIYNSIFCRLWQSKMLHLQPNLLYEDKNRFVQRWLELCKLCVTGEEAL